MSSSGIQSPNIHPGSSCFGLKLVRPQIYWTHCKACVANFLQKWLTMVPWAEESALRMPCATGPVEGILGQTRPPNAHNSQTIRTCVGSPQQHIFFVPCFTPRQVLARPKMGHNPYFLATRSQKPNFWTMCEAMATTPIISILQLFPNLFYTSSPQLLCRSCVPLPLILHTSTIPLPSALHRTPNPLYSPDPRPPASRTHTSSDTGVHGRLGVRQA